MADEGFYSLPVGMIYLFNLLLGTGVLTMPAVFDQAGYVTGILCIMILCLVSYVQTTFLVESMANANFVKRMQHLVPNDFSNNKTRRSKGNSTEMSALLDEYNEEDDSGFRRHSLATTTTTTTPPTTFNNCDGHHDNDDDDDDYSYYSASNLEPDLKVLCSSNTNVDQIDGGHQNQGFEYLESISTVAAQQAANCDEDCLQTYQQNINHLGKRFNIIEKFELGNMTEMFLDKYLSRFFFISIISYLFGDLLIYNSMMAKSLRELSCTSTSYCNFTNITNETDNNDHYLDSKCWDNSSITRRNAYRLFLLGFISILGPLTYAKIQKTKVIQIMTIILRWIAFLSMIGITIYIFATKQAKGRPTKVEFKNLPKLFGICVYSFMCHHSVPSIMTPIKNKSKLYLGITVDYILVLAFYLIISMTAIFAFENIQQIYTLNFQIDKCASNQESNPANIIGFDIFLPTFPIFTLFSSYTILALTLINNMKVLIDFDYESRYGPIAQYSLPLVAIIPPLAIALFTEDVSSIVQYVGSYSGTLIQYFFPSLLIYYSRKQVRYNFMLPYLQQLQIERYNTSANVAKMNRHNIANNVDSLYLKLNPFCSRFQSNFWIYFTWIWWIVCLFLVTLDHLRDILHLY